jgi:U2 small nuclear ribonucleoprotein A'
MSGTNDAAPRERKILLTPEEKKKLQEMILNAKDLNEMARLEKALAEGKMPAGVMSHS